jgi:hypothetical protein
VGAGDDHRCFDAPGEVTDRLARMVAVENLVLDVVVRQTAGLACEPSYI